MFHIVGCDACTRTFLEEQSMTMPDDLEWPLEPREVAKQVGHNWQLEQRKIVQQKSLLQGTSA